MLQLLNVLNKSKIDLQTFAKQGNNSLRRFNLRIISYKNEINMRNLGELISRCTMAVCGRCKHVNTQSLKDQKQCAKNVSLCIKL